MVIDEDNLEPVANRLLVVGLNPAWQRTVRLPSLAKGEVNRALSIHEMASGKGVNAAEAVARLGGAAGLLQMAGGTTGRLLLADLERRGFAHWTVATAAATRVCTTLLAEDDQSMTELIEPSPRATSREVEELRRRLPQALADCGSLAICGTFPDGVPSTFYAEIVGRMRERAWIVVDAWRCLREALEAGPHLLKINAEELRGLTGCKDGVKAARCLFERFDLWWLAVTDGSRDAFLFSRSGGWRYRLPRLEAVVSPLGAGDTATGAVLQGLAGGLGARTDFADRDWAGRAMADRAMSRLFRFALAAASASCLGGRPAEFRREDVARLEPLVEMTPLS